MKIIRLLGLQESKCSKVLLKVIEIEGRKSKMILGDNLDFEQSVNFNLVSLK
jgi:hypothetical protein